MTEFDILCYFIVLPGILLGAILGFLISKFGIRNKNNLAIYLLIISSIGIIVSFLLNPMIILTSGLFLLIFLFRSNKGATKDFAPVEWVTSGYIKQIDETEEKHPYEFSNTQINLFTMIIFLVISITFILVFPFGF